MPLKQRKDGTWSIETGKDMDAAVEAIEEREEGIKTIEENMEDEFDYLTMKQEIVDLKEELRRFMTANDQAQVIRDDYKIVLIRRMRSSWNVNKLKKVLSKGQYLKIVKMTVDPAKIDDLVRRGDIDEKLIASALEQTPDKPYLRWFYGNEDAADTEAAKVAEAMNA
jgi:hypothetical protein